MPDKRLVTPTSYPELFPGPDAWFQKPGLPAQHQITATHRHRALAAPAGTTP